VGILGSSYRNFWQKGSKTSSDPQQFSDDAALEELKVDKFIQTEDSRYDSMTDVQRDAYYVNPNLRTRFRKWMRGS
jgi:hypothetical protein